ncbi:lipoprotein [Pseudomonas sp. StFLB209]|uniref:LEA type 2 family protein n=1 Tax=Pseudomonas sp. StFLB209 TaxID=1028989 RepID=UPI0004F6661F|nr:LEA type 2 family protein [Pseudomonas sp. StFLB209]BAP44986.1 lipoprotein [Pseudomonas sp. StFLB209]
MLRHTRRLLLVSLFCALGACAWLPDRDPLVIEVAGIEPLPGEGLEVRMAVKLRVQNPNDSEIHYNGVALRLEVNDRLLASGVSDQHGRVASYSQALITVPVSITAFSVLRQTLGLGEAQARGRPLDGLPYTLHGKFGGGPFGTQRFSSSGTLNLPGSATGGW